MSVHVHSNQESGTFLTQLGNGDIDEDFEGYIQLPFGNFVSDMDIQMPCLLHDIENQFMDKNWLKGAKIALSLSQFFVLEQIFQCQET